MAESTFDVRAVESRLVTQRIGREWITLAEIGSTNDAAWERHGAGGADGLVVVADAQTRGRGRAGRTWHTAPGRGLALSLLLRDGVDRRPLGVLPLASGLALVTALDRLGVSDAALKWPNDVLLGGAKVGGILCESRGSSRATAAVVGLGVNVAQRADDFPPELVATRSGAAGVDAASCPALPATSLALEGHALTREIVAAEFLNALEPLWIALAEAGGAPVLEAWQRRATFWGRTVRVVTPAGAVEGVARRLDAGGGLVLAVAGEGEITVLAGDVVPVTS